MKNERIKKTQLQEEIMLLIKDNFIAKISDKENIEIEFLNGQRFSIHVEEVSK